MNAPVDQNIVSHDVLGNGLTQWNLCLSHWCGYKERLMERLQLNDGCSPRTNWNVNEREIAERPNWIIV